MLVDEISPTKSDGRASIKLFNVFPQHPYSEYSNGYVYVRPDANNRKYLLLYKRGGEQLGTTYARYLMSIMTGHKVSDDLHVDHINNDPSDDRFENYQLLTPEQNSKKGSVVTGEHCLVMLCPVCQQKTVQTFHRTHFSQSRGTIVTFCSSRCAGKFNGSSLMPETARDIGQHQTLYEIRTHWFEYEDYFHEYYPHTEIIRTLSRKYLSEDGSRCKDIPGLTEFCWDIFTPSEERGATMIAMAEQKVSLREMSRRLGMDRKLISQYLKQVRPDLVKTPRTEELYPIIKAGIEAGQSLEDIGAEIGWIKAQVYEFARYHKLITLKTRARPLSTEQQQQLLAYV